METFFIVVCFFAVIFAIIHNIKKLIDYDKKNKDKKGGEI